MLGSLFAANYEWGSFWQGVFNRTLAWGDDGIYGAYVLLGDRLELGIISMA